MRLLTKQTAYDHETGTSTVTYSYYVDVLIGLARFFDRAAGRVIHRHHKEPK